MKILRYASAIWNGPVPTGTGSMSLGRNQGTTIPFSLKSRTEENAGTNPEEMLGAAMLVVSPWHLPASWKMPD